MARQDHERRRAEILAGQVVFLERVLLFAINIYSKPIAGYGVRSRRVGWLGLGLGLGSGLGSGSRLGLLWLAKR
jgi:hypothetical protein